MARFILDVGSTEPIMSNKNIQDILNGVCALLNNEEYSNGIVKITCVDNSHTNQFHSEFDNGETNKLTDSQILFFNFHCNTL